MDNKVTLGITGEVKRHLYTYSYTLWAVAYSKIKNMNFGIDYGMSLISFLLILRIILRYEIIKCD